MKKTSIAILLMGALTSGCSTWNDTSTGVAIGSLGGLAVGALVGNTEGALIGAVGGALAGGGVGYYMDKQAQDFQKVLAPEIDRGQIIVNKASNHTITVIMTTNTSFATNSAIVKSNFYSTLNKIANVVNRYGKTKLSITGYTDNTGSDAINQPLSEQRARSIASYFLGKNVLSARVSVNGRGSKDPVASNASPEGRAANRRVEIVIEPITQ